MWDTFGKGAESVQPAVMELTWYLDIFYMDDEGWVELTDMYVHGAEPVHAGVLCVHGADARAGTCTCCRPSRTCCCSQRRTSSTCYASQGQHIQWGTCLSSSRHTSA